MAQQNNYEGIKHVVHISTDVGQACEHCDFNIGLDNFPESINHYINVHGYKILHIGQETTRDMEENPVQVTVAVLGK